MKQSSITTFSVAASAAVDAVDNPPFANSDRAQIIERTRSWIESWRTNPSEPFNLDNFRHIYAQDETFSSFDFGRPHDGFRDWASAQAYYRKFMTVPKVWWLKANDDLKVHMSGNIAWSTISLTGGGETRDGTLIEMPEGRVTLILEKRGDQWLIVHEHGSSALPFPGIDEVNAMLTDRV